MFTDNPFPEQWVLLEAIEAHSIDGRNRELYVAHTSKMELEIIERQWQMFVNTTTLYDRDRR
ncbi:hypothetical protein EHV15_01150 [Paenibacillus oralis]|uniref:Uncharacterized protein n=1 Tax=Paenibacillus oralis TaxID=2490856 RepID=A0A3P3UB09_9BACL|nr:hypothetical protein EHV15_01150 [Paenibacillus oralis]